MDIFLVLTVVLIIIIFTIVIFKRPCAEFFENAVDKLLKKSSVMYSNDGDEAAYYKSLENSNSLDLLIMNRCIEFKKEGIEKVIDVLKTQNRFFISNKYTTKYSEFSTIKDTIKNNMMSIYNITKQKLHGPIYLLITQYPVYTKTYKDMDRCVKTSLSVPNKNDFSPIIHETVEDCGEPETLIECEYYILMPAHKPFNGGVGEYNYKTWDEIKKNMEILLVGGNDNVLNVRSKNQQCFIKCGLIQTDGYTCASRNSVNDKPYNTIVYNSPSNNKQEKVLTDYANLYIINTNGINLLLGITIDPIIETGVNIEAISLPIQSTRDTVFGTDVTQINDHQENEFMNVNYEDFIKIQKEIEIQNKRLEVERQLYEMSDEQAKCYIMRYPDLKNKFGSDIARAKTHWVENGISEGRTKECTETLLRMVNGTTNGLTRERAAPSAKHIVDVYKTTGNGVYWIDLPTVGPTQVFCIMNPQCDGGGWMLAMKGSHGDIFKYNASYWNTPNTLNKANPSRLNANAKYDVFNHYKATDWLAGFPDVPSYKGDISRDAYDGFTWLERNAVGSSKTLLEVFSLNKRIDKSRDPRGLAKFNDKVWSSQSGFKWYGINYKGSRHSTRWGFTWNNEKDEKTNDVVSGIGTNLSSAGDHYESGNKKLGKKGLDRDIRFEFFVR